MASTFHDKNNMSGYNGLRSSYTTAQPRELVFLAPDISNDAYVKNYKEHSPNADIVTLTNIQEPDENLSKSQKRARLLVREEHAEGIVFGQLRQAAGDVAKGKPPLDTLTFGTHGKEDVIYLAGKDGLGTTIQGTLSSMVDIQRANGGKPFVKNIVFFGCSAGANNVDIEALKAKSKELDATITMSTITAQTFFDKRAPIAEGEFFQITPNGHVKFLRNMEDRFLSIAREESAAAGNDSLLMEVATALSMQQCDTKNSKVCTVLKDKYAQWKSYEDAKKTLNGNPGARGDAYEDETATVHGVASDLMRHRSPITDIYLPEMFLTVANHANIGSDTWNKNIDHALQLVGDNFERWERSDKDTNAHFNAGNYITRLAQMSGDAKSVYKKAAVYLAGVKGGLNENQKSLQDAVRENQTSDKDHDSAGTPKIKLRMGPH